MNEWTVEKQSTRNAWYLRSGQQLITSSPYYSLLQAVADAHNSELAASNSQLDEAESHNAVADRELRELRQQLAAEREKHKDCWDKTTQEHYEELEAEFGRQNLKLLQAHELLKRIRLRHSNNDSTIREIDAELAKVKQ